VTPELPANPTLAQRFAALDSGMRMRLMVGVVLLVGGLLLVLVLGRQTDWKVMYSGLAEKDGAAVVAQLVTLNVPYKFTEGGGAIMVPAERVHELRLKMASLGIPKGSVNGFELMETNRFGMTQFQERLTFQRGLEGELTRSIQSISSVSSARVHLALPNQNGFFREQQKPSASVLLSLHPGRMLDKTQLAGIVNLVASSVPEMTAAAVSVLDDSGKLLSKNADGTGGMGADAEQLQYVQNLENVYSQRIMEILEPIVGKQNVRAQVTAELDFSQSESTTESHQPNQTPQSGAVRSQQLMESVNGQTPSGPSGIPGATTNQPPAPPAAPVNGQAQALTPASNNSSAANGATSKKESIINYEVDKTVKVVKGATGIVKRINAAVVLNNQSVTDESGNVTSVPLTEAQLEKMTALVREAVGFNKDRGDSVNLMNAPFVVDSNKGQETAFWRSPEMLQMAHSFAWPVGLLLVTLVVLFGFVRPAMKKMNQPAATPESLAEAQALAQGQGGGLNALEDDSLDRPQLTGPDGQVIDQSREAAQLRLEEARRLARENPLAVANIMKAWINGEAQPS
jgi:flagellar M-ring protein FliF